MRFRRSASSIEVLPSPAICSAVSARPWPCSKPRTGVRRRSAKVLITGGVGFIGANFVLYWRRVYPDDLIVVLDALTYAGNRANLDAMQGDKQFEFVHGESATPGWFNLCFVATTSIWLCISRPKAMSTG